MIKESLNPNLSESDEAHQQYVKCLQEADEMRERLDELRSQELELKIKLDAIGSSRREARAAREEKALNKFANSLFVVDN